MQTRPAGHAPGRTLLLILVLASLTACGTPSVSGSDGEGRGDFIPEVDSSEPTSETVTMRDPVENAFTVEVPEGWDSVAYSSGGLDLSRNMVSSVSPDGKTVMFIGDPKMPMYWSPDWVDAQFQAVVDVIEFYETKAYEPAESFFSEYVTRKFGELPGFEITNVSPDLDLLAGMEQNLVNTGSPFTVTTADCVFDTRHQARPSTP